MYLRIILSNIFICMFSFNVVWSITNDSIPNLYEVYRPLWNATNDEGFITKWNVCGPFENGNRAMTIDSCLILEKDKEPFLIGVGNNTLQDRYNKKYSWISYESDKDIIDLQKALASNAENVFAYAYTEVNMNNNDTCKELSIAADDIAKVWVNSNMVYKKAIEGPTILDDVMVPVKLLKGKNRILVKVENRAKGWSFALRFISKEGIRAHRFRTIQPVVLSPVSDTVKKLEVLTDNHKFAKLCKDPTPIKVEIAGAGGKVYKRWSALRGDTCKIATSLLKEGVYDIRISYVQDGIQCYRHFPWFKGDWKKFTYNTIKYLEKGDTEKSNIETKLHKKLLRSMLLSRILPDFTNQTFTDSILKEAINKIYFQKISSPLAEYEELLLGENASIHPFGYRRLSWIDSFDNSPQYARLSLPPTFHTGKKWPLLVTLHGYDPSNQPYYNIPGAFNRFDPLVEASEMCVLAPFGRGNTGYYGIGENDVLRAIDIACQTIPIDRNRIYLMGFSMGGGGTWRLAMKHPDIFAAAAPIYGGWDYHVWDSFEKIKTLHPLELFNQNRDASFCQLENLYTTPIIVSHGDKDPLVDYKHSRYAAITLQRWGYPVYYWEVPDGKHGNLGNFEKIAIALSQKRLEKYPNILRLRSPYLKYAHVHWLRVTDMERPMEFIEGQGNIYDSTTIKIETHNAKQIRVDLQLPQLSSSKPIEIFWNFKSIGFYSKKQKSIVYPPVNTDSLRKTADCEGPQFDLRNKPFAIIVGTISHSKEMIDMIAYIANRNSEEWHNYQHVKPRVYIDTECTLDTLKKYNLEIIGGPNENMVALKMKDFLPFTFYKDSIISKIGKVAGKDHALSFIYPNPYNNQRMITITAATSVRAMYHSNKLESNVDYSIDDFRIVPDTNLSRDKYHLMRGYFDRTWNIDSKYMCKRDERLNKGVLLESPKIMNLQSSRNLPKIYLSDYMEKGATGSFTQAGRNMKTNGAPISFNNLSYAKGLSVYLSHEKSSITYDLTGNKGKQLISSLFCEIGKPITEMDSKEKENTAAICEIVGDGKVLFTKKLTYETNKIIPINIGVENVKELTIRVNGEHPWFNEISQVCWGDLRIE